ncbi:MAG: alpha/beta fold hydrolase, partial [Actinomycetota bacterium]
PEFGDRVEGGWIPVPIDYSDPSAGTIRLRVIRHLADPDDRIGVLFTNNGGPGVAASSMATRAEDWFESPIVERFDIVAWDPRGTGVSDGAVDCIDGDQYDRYFASLDITPETTSERQQLIGEAETFAQACIANAGDLLPHLGTNNTARDLDAIRQSLGEEQASYLGYSYGSELGAVWATLFPDTVRAAVLDGAGHPDPEGTEPVRQQWLGFEGVFATFLAECSADSDCVFHNDGDAEGAADALFTQLDESPLPSDGGRAPVNQAVAINGVIQALYSDSRWPALERALADAASGDGSGLLALHDGYFRRRADGSYSNLLEAFQAINCADEPERLDPDAADERAADLIGVAPRLFPQTTGSYTCGFFPPSADPRIEITGERAGPIVVIGTTGDPSTPLTASRAMANRLDEGVLVTVEANRHTAYRSGGCINDVVHDYLIWLDVPPVDTVCS